MLNSLVIKNFRMLEDFTVEKLGRVNLIVGKNNSGKSTVLETLRIYAGVDKEPIRESDYRTNSYDGTFYVTGTSKKAGIGDEEKSLTPIGNFFRFKCGFIPTQFISMKELEDDWKKIELSDDEEIITQALQIVLPTYQRLAFDGEKPNRWIKVKLSNLSKAIPLKSLGDGMLRILQIAIKMVSAQGGFLLIDEFENGLHYSVQENVWRLLFEMAEKLDIQVFATTHSWDCIESFVTVAQQKPEADAVLFRMGKSVGKSDYGKVISTVFSGDDLSYITQSNMEIR